MENLVLLHMAMYDMFIWHIKCALTGEVGGKHCFAVYAHIWLYIYILFLPCIHIPESMQMIL